MNIQYYHKNISSLGEASRQYIASKIRDISDIRKVDSARVEIDQQKNSIFHMSVQLNCGRDVFFADANATDVNGCIDQIKDELATQVRRKKKRVRDLMKRGARSLKKKMTIDNKARL